MINILKKNGIIQPFDGNKIISAIRKSATRVCITLTGRTKRKKLMETKINKLQITAFTTNSEFYIPFEIFSIY